LVIKEEYVIYFRVSLLSSCVDVEETETEFIVLFVISNNNNNNILIIFISTFTIIIIFLEITYYLKRLADSVLNLFDVP
jgi:hypothetical protein